MTGTIKNGEMYLFDPTQFAEFGYSHFEGDGFSYRYQFSRKLFWKSIYIPLGPNCESEQGFDNFLKHIKSQRFTKVKIDLPAIYSPKRSAQVIKKLILAGFKKSNYIQDEETIIVVNDDLVKMPHSEMNQVRYGLKRADIIVKDSVTEEDIDQIYEIYLVAAKRLEIKPKPKNVFNKMSEKCLVSLAYDKESGKLEGFLFNYLIKTDLSEITNKPSRLLLSLILTGLTDRGRELRLGRAIYYELFKIAFEKYNVDVADFHGASRSKGRSYMGFKESFSKRFISLPGSFTRTKYF